MEKDIREILDELFKLIGIDVKVEISEKKEETETIYQIELDPGESAGLLIGLHGSTLSAIQSFLGIALKQKTGEWVKISLDIAGWNKKQNQRLIELAQNAAERARQINEEQKLYNLTAAQRRIVHMALSTETGIETVSEGEGADRYLIVRPKK